MTDKLKLIWVYGISGLFIALHLYLMVTKDFYWAALFPLALLIFILYFISLDKIIFLIVLLTPLAINIQNFDMGVSISLPTEPLMIGVLVLFFLRLCFDGKIDFRVLKHPVSIAIFANLIWMLFTSITSQMPLVSFKFLVSRLWFVIPFYFVGIQMFREQKNIKPFFWMYIVSFSVVIIYTIYKHSNYGFSEEAGHWVMTPFYNDHTAYGAMLAFFIPVLAGFFFIKEYGQGTRILSAGLLIFFLLALILSYSRAAWLSLAATAVVFLIILFKIKLRWLILSGIAFLALFMVYQQQIFDKLEQNEQDTSANFVEHIQSITNISSDASNLERINRWQSALRMFRERPFWGWGPGTYQFMYAPYQRSAEKTIISTNAGDLGNAHSEYIGPLAESGVLGMLTFLFIAITSIYTGLKVYRKASSRQLKIISLVTVLSLFSYLMHGFLNNFLDTDKASVPFWGFIAIIVAIDIFYRNEKNSDVKN
ncbi:MAG: O-antigen ligase family protein [Bacteroidales bacterium]|nr:O-antigen ligase family protein [Bacteroidales bacterium]